MSFEKLNFWQLLNNVDRIEIPIIQRDYAQGREKQNKIRSGFLTTLHDALHKNPEELEFIYGSEKSKIFQPLDGQQRLTTLFLLHWFIALKENKLNENSKVMLSKFTYETRTSSREFCDALVNKNIELKNEEKISITITYTPWFVSSWIKDPTISAMLIMLDAIRDMFGSSGDLWEKLTKEQNITFLYLRLEDFGLSDDLYIKMNARGKQLTDFEGFKSPFEKYIEEREFEKDVKNAADKFAQKIDTVWTDLFWRHRDKDNQIDQQLINFIAETAVLNYAQYLEIIKNEKEHEQTLRELTDKKRKNITDNLVKRTRIEKRIEYLSNNPDDVNINDFPVKEYYSFLTSMFNIYSENKNDSIKPEIDLWDYCGNDSDLFKIFINGKVKGLTYKIRVLFYAQSMYLFNNKTVNKNNFNDWMRVIRNIVYNADIDSAGDFIRAVGLIKELSEGCSDIYKHLLNAKIQSEAAETQVKEEIRKSKIIINNSKYKKLLFDLEDTVFCMGVVNWCLNCLNSDDEPELSKLEKIKTIIDNHLNNDITNDFRRALLTTGDTCYYYFVSWSWSTETNKFCFTTSGGDLKEMYTKGDRFEKYFKELIIQLMEGKSLRDIIDGCIKNMPNWKKRLLKEPDLLDNHCKGYYFGITNDVAKCYLYKEKKRPGARDECFLVE